MSRLQKKCFIGAASMHVLLFVVLIVGPGFFSKDDTMDESEVLTFVTLMATDSARAGGGTPQPSNPTPPARQVATPTTPKPQVEEQTPPPEQPQVRAQVRENPRVPDKVEKSEKVEDNTKTRDNRDSLQPKTDKSKKHEVKVNTKVVAISKDRRNPTTNSSNTDATAQERKDREQLANAFARAGSRAKDSLSTSTRVDMPEGPGGGGVSYANFAQIVRKVYTDAWRIPDDVTDDEAVVKVSVTIARNGSVISSRIIVESGSRMVDRSIQNALDRVTTIGVAFPIGAKESQRTFTINFSLKAKKLLG
jgi:outer membrane biosynthesis protein TonB